MGCCSPPGKCGTRRNGLDKLASVHERSPPEAASGARIIGPGICGYDGVDFLTEPTVKAGSIVPNRVFAHHSRRLTLIVAAAIGPSAVSGVTLQAPKTSPP